MNALEKGFPVDDKRQQLLMEEILPSPVEVGSLSIVYKVLYILGGAGFFPSTLSLA